MASYAKTIIVGNITRDPELKYTPAGQAVAEFGIAVNERYTKNGEKVEKVHFFDVVAWAKTAELVSQFCKKGSSVLVDGKLTQERWEDQQQQKRSKVKVVAERVIFLDKKPTDGESAAAAAPADAGVGEDVPF